MSWVIWLGLCASALLILIGRCTSHLESDFYTESSFLGDFWVSTPVTETPSILWETETWCWPAKVHLIHLQKASPLLGLFLWLLEQTATADTQMHSILPFIRHYQPLGKGVLLSTVWNTVCLASVPQSVEEQPTQQHSSEG